MNRLGQLKKAKRAGTPNFVNSVNSVEKSSKTPLTISKYLTLTLLREMKASANGLRTPFGARSNSAPISRNNKATSLRKKGQTNLKLLNSAFLILTFFLLFSTQPIARGWENSGNFDTGGVGSSVPSPFSSQNDAVQKYREQKKEEHQQASDAAKAEGNEEQANEEQQKVDEYEKMSREKLMMEMSKSSPQSDSSGMSSEAAQAMADQEAPSMTDGNAGEDFSKTTAPEAQNPTTPFSPDAPATETGAPADIDPSTGTSISEDTAAAPLEAANNNNGGVSANDGNGSTEKSPPSRFTQWDPANGTPAENEYGKGNVPARDADQFRLSEDQQKANNEWLQKNANGASIAGELKPETDLNAAGGTPWSESHPTTDISTTQEQKMGQTESQSTFTTPDGTKYYQMEPPSASEGTESSQATSPPASSPGSSSTRQPSGGSGQPSGQGQQPDQGQQQCSSCGGGGQQSGGGGQQQSGGGGQQQSGGGTPSSSEGGYTAQDLQNAAKQAAEAQAAYDQQQLAAAQQQAAENTAASSDQRAGSTGAKSASELKSNVDDIKEKIAAGEYKTKDELKNALQSIISDAATSFHAGQDVLSLNDYNVVLSGVYNIAQANGIDLSSDTDTALASDNSNDENQTNPTLTLDSDTLDNLTDVLTLVNSSTTRTGSSLTQPTVTVKTNNSDALKAAASKATQNPDLVKTAFGAVANNPSLLSSILAIFNGKASN